MTLWVAAARKKAAYPCPDAVLRNLERSALDDDNNEKGDGVDPTDRNSASNICDGVPAGSLLDSCQEHWVLIQTAPQKSIVCT